MRPTINSLAFTAVGINLAASFVSKPKLTDTPNSDVRRQQQEYPSPTHSEELEVIQPPNYMRIYKAIRAALPLVLH
jgi:hypothetical protein